MSIHLLTQYSTNHQDLTSIPAHLFPDLDDRFNCILVKAFNFLDLKSFLNACQASKQLFKVLTNVHRKVTCDDDFL
jgi:predicted transcriptional regulator